MLIALRIWRIFWLSSRFRLAVEGDSTTALCMLAYAKTKSSVNTALARELALEFGTGLYVPDAIQHISGVSNKVPDYLSRCMAWKSSDPWPATLHGAIRAPVPTRTAACFRASRPPGRANIGAHGREGL